MSGGGIELQLSVWLAYLACCIGVLAMLWRWMKPAGMGLAAMTLLLLALVLLLPFGVPGEDSLAPAWIVALFELSQGRNEAPLAIAKLLSLLLFLALLASLLWRRIRGRAKTGQKSA